MFRRKIGTTILVVATVFAVASCNSSRDSDEQSTSPEGASILKESYAIGDVGPGGGIVFFVAPEQFESAGSDCATQCRYLEVAPSDSEVIRTWSSGTNQAILLPPAPDERWVLGIGSGMANTKRIVDQPGNEPGSSAAAYAHEYENNGKTDWHLPSLLELNELCKYARQQNDDGADEIRVIGSLDFVIEGMDYVSCGVNDDLNKSIPSPGVLRKGFLFAGYWSSSEHHDDAAWYQSFDHGHEDNADKVERALVRPVRAF
jgi:hypothetical protein